jgi:Fic family protein
MLNLENSPYLLDSAAEREISDQITALEERVDLLRRSGTLTNETLANYYGEKRFEQVAESNAIEGSTLSIGETELAVLKGITITGHDPGYIRDARALDTALQRMTEMARENKSPTNIEQLLELHSLILGDRPSAGKFRDEPVRIKGSDHRPPKYWPEIMEAMEAWQAWSQENSDAPAILRAIILHAWLVHIHPFIDGNGRTARAITNLELIRSGYPPIIIKKKERDRYIEALSESDSGGVIRAFFELLMERAEGSLIGLEISAKQKQGYSPLQEKIRKRQQQQLNIWDASVHLLVQAIDHFVHEEIDAVGGDVYIKDFESPLELDDYISLCERRTSQRSWVFITNLGIPGFPKQVRLAYLGYRTPQMFHALGDEGGPSIFWSRKNESGYPKWLSTEEQAPFAVEITTKQGAGDEWYARKSDGSVSKLATTELAKRIARSLVEMAADNK